MSPDRLGFMQPIRSCLPSSPAGACIDTATRHVKPKASLYSQYICCPGAQLCGDHLCFGQLYKHLGSRLDDRHLIEDGGSVICNDDLSIRLAHLLMHSSHHLFSGKKSTHRYLCCVHKIFMQCCIDLQRQDQQIEILEAVCSQPHHLVHAPWPQASSHGICDCFCCIDISYSHVPLFRVTPVHVKKSLD